MLTREFVNSVVRTIKRKVNKKANNIQNSEKSNLTISCILQKEDSYILR